MNLPADLPTRLRDHGLKVVEVPGWRDRGRPASTGGFAPAGVLCHHTATSKATSDAAVIHLLVVGRTDLPGPLAQLGLARDGTVHIVAAGRCNHAGVAKSVGTMAGGDGNTIYAGIEAFNAGTGEPWTQEQYDAYWLLAAALSIEVTGNSARTVNGHKETSVTGKIDPAGPTPDGPTFDMDKFRAHVAKAIAAATSPKPKPPKPPTPTPTETFDVSVLSGRFDRGDKKVAAAWQQERDQGQSLLLGTELAGRTDETLIGDDGDRYRNLHSEDGTRGETAVQFARADWRIVDTFLVKVWDGGGRGRFAHPAYARATVLQNRNVDRELVDIQNHDAAHLFKGSRFFNPANVVRWRKIRNRQATAMKQLRADHPDAAFMVSGDPNASGTFLARYMARHFAGFKPANGFKFGAVWVDGLRRVGPVESVPTPSSDHPIQRMTLAWKK